MLSASSESNFYAKRAVILGHKRTTAFGMGEKTVCLKMQALLNCPLLDIMDLLQEYYEPLARLNYALADQDFSLVEELSLPFAKNIHKKIPPSEIFLLLSVGFSAAAFFATALHKTRPTVVKLYAHHPNERVLTKLYEPASLLVTESLLASQRAFAYKIPHQKVLYLPHHYPATCEKIKPSRHYVENLAKKQGKQIKKQTLVFGCVARLEYGKNCEYAVEAVRYLAHLGHDVVLVLKGTFPKESPYPAFQTHFSELLESYKKEPWLLWDTEETAFPEVLSQYGSFDVLLHPSGAEGASHIVVECLGLKIPVVLLDCSSNVYLFKNCATFVKTTGQLQKAVLPFFIPDMDDFIAALLAKAWKAPDETLIRRRFHPDVCAARLPYLFDRNPDKITRFYEEDRKLYDL